MGQTLPRARQESLIVKDLCDEILIYDLAKDKAHCLNYSAAFVWRHCDGQTTVAAACKKLEAALNTRVDEEVVWLALQQLNQFDLLANSVKRPQRTISSRRTALRNLGIAALAIPAIITMSAPTAQAQASCLPRDAGCTSNAECCSGNCRGNNLCA